MKKRVFAVVLCCLMLTGLLAACAGDDGGGAAGSGKVVLLGEAYPVPEMETAWNEVATAFTEATGIEVELRRQGTWDEIPQALQAARLGGEQVDLCVIGVGTIRSTLAPAGMVMDITDLMADLGDRFPEGILDSGKIGDRLFAFPYYDASGTTFYYNKTLFEELQIQPPESFEDMVAISQTIRDEKGIAPLTFHGKDVWGWPMFFFDTYAQTTGNRSVENVEAFLKGEYQFTGAEEQEAFALIKELVDEGVMDLDVLDTDSDGMRAVFGQQRAAMMFGGTWEYPVLKSMELDFEVGAFEFLAMYDGAKPQHAFGVGDGAISIPAFASQENLGNTMRFVEYLLRPENAKKILTAGTDPLFEVVNGAVGSEDEVTVFLNEKLVPNSVMYLDWIWPAEVNDAFCNVIPAVLNGSMTPEQAAQGVQDSYDNLVREKDYTYDWWNSWTEEDWAKVRPSSIPDVNSFKE